MSFIDFKPEGQVWEECEICGEEPVYLPLFRCERHWPGGLKRDVPDEPVHDTLEDQT